MFFLPRRTIACERILAEEGVAGDVVAGEYPLGFIPFDYDLLSLEMPSAFRVGAPAACSGQQPAVCAVLRALWARRAGHWAGEQSS